MKRLQNDYLKIYICHGFYDFVENFKNSYPTKRELKINKYVTDGIFICRETFNDNKRYFINYLINELKIDKNDKNIKIIFYGDEFCVYDVVIYNNDKILGEYEF